MKFWKAIIEFLQKYRWWLVTSLVALGAIAIIYQNYQTTPAVFDFNDGTTQGWTVEGIYDDNDAEYTVPPNALKSASTGDALVFSSSGTGQLALFLQQNGFPDDSKYWQVDLISPTLGPAWNGLKGIEASIRDQISVEDNSIEATLFVEYAVSGNKVTVPAKASFNPTIPHGKKTLVSEMMTIPAEAKLLNITVTIRGRWAILDSTTNPPMYEGFVHVDDVRKIL